jgi:tetratricopeptide (TPR) repeat protein
MKPAILGGITALVLAHGLVLCMTREVNDTEMNLRSRAVAEGISETQVPGYWHAMLTETPIPMSYRRVFCAAPPENAQGLQLPWLTVLAQTQSGDPRLRSPFLPPALARFVSTFLLAEHPSRLLITTREVPVLPAMESGALDEIRLDRGLPTSDGVSLLLSQIPEGASQVRERVEAAVNAVDGIPYAVERMAYLLRNDRLLEVGKAVVREDTLDAFVTLAHSTLSDQARLTLQARAVFDEPVPREALTHVLDGTLVPGAIDVALEELGRGHFLFPVGPEALLGLHEFDQESSYRSIERVGRLDRRMLHLRAADYYARRCEERPYWFEWTSYDELRNDLRRFDHLVKAGNPIAAAGAFSVSKVEFLNYAGHVEQIQSMFAALDVGADDTRALLVKRYALADSLVVVGPFERAIEELRDVAELARRLGDVHAELSATYEIGLALRYTGHGDEAVHALKAMTDRLRALGEERWLAYSLYGYSLACSYAGRYADAVRLGREQLRYGRRSGQSYFVGRANSSLCLAYHLIGKAQEAADCAAASRREFVNTPNEYMVGFIENVRGLSLQALGRGAEALEAYAHARTIGRRTVQRRAVGLAAANWAWSLYALGDLDGAQARIDEAIGVFTEISGADAILANRLREAFEYAREGNPRDEAEALAEFVRSEYVNPDLVPRTMVAERILSLGHRAPPAARQAAESLVEATRNRLAAVLAELDD